MSKHRMVKQRTAISELRVWQFGKRVAYRIINIHIYRFVWIWARRSSCHLAQILIDIKMFYFRIV